MSSRKNKGHQTISERMLMKGENRNRHIIPIMEWNIGEIPRVCKNECISYGEQYIIIPIFNFIIFSFHACDQLQILQYSVIDFRLKEFYITKIQISELYARLVMGTVPSS